MRLRLALAVSLVAALAIGATIAAPAGAGKSATVKLGDNFFKPAKKKVKRGTKVKFKWVGSNSHNVVKRSGPGKSFASSTTAAPGVNFKRKFKRTGKYKLVCTIHDGMKMKLKVK